MRKGIIADPTASSRVGDDDGRRALSAARA